MAYSEQKVIIQATQTNHAIREPENEVEVTQNVTQNIPSTK